MSAGTANPTTWPRCLFPAAYGQAGATKIFCLCRFSAKDVLRSGEDHDTSSLSSRPSAEGKWNTRRDGQSNQKDDREMGPSIRPDVRARLADGNGSRIAVQTLRRLFRPCHVRHDR